MLCGGMRVFYQDALPLHASPQRYYKWGREEPPVGAPNGTSLPIVGHLPGCCHCLHALGGSNVADVSSHRLTTRVNAATSRIQRSFGYVNSIGNHRNVNCSIRGLLDVLRRLLFNGNSLLPAVLVNYNHLNGTIDHFVAASAGNCGLVTTFSGTPSRINGRVGNVQVLRVSRLRTFYTRRRPRITILYLPHDNTRRVDNHLITLNVRNF